MMQMMKSQSGDRLVTPTILVLVFLALVCSGAPSNVNLAPLPYPDYSALEPYVSKQTLTIHHDRHHAKYVKTTQDMIARTDLASASLEEIMVAAKARGDAVLFNNAAQSWNHAFYWKCMAAAGGGKPAKQKLLSNLINGSFGSYKKFAAAFARAGNTAFGSGWAWLVYEKSTQKLIIMKTTGAENPLASRPEEWTPILTMDVWEHAYYLDYQNKRDQYVTIFLEKLLNWDFVAQNLDAAIEKKKPGSNEL